MLWDMLSRYIVDVADAAVVVTKQRMRIRIRRSTWTCEVAARAYFESTISVPVGDSVGSALRRYWSGCCCFSGGALKENEYALRQLQKQNVHVVDPILCLIWICISYIFIYILRKV